MAVVKTMPFHMQVYQILRESILTGKYRPGERLLEQKLAQELEVSRSPVREALRMLEQDGLVVTMDNGSGTIVNPMKVEDIEEIYQCRIATEPYAGYLASLKIKNEEIEGLRKLVQESEEAYLHKESERVVKLNTMFHEQIVRISGNSRLIEIVDKISSLSILSRNNEFKVYSRTGDFLDEHKAIVEAFAKKNPNNVESVIRKHIENDWKYYSQQYRTMNEVAKNS